MGFEHFRVTGVLYLIRMVLSHIKRIKVTDAEWTEKNKNCLSGD